ncbi:translation initiation factor IF-2-like [Sciurus carolinensis]|uniref:translation initiation factor IF-2-like n=1 Tax=Sciurus carolinensis TaxID=30640 RepID=UPI001FB45C7E|nr:translation initiation factor IF-2-like [Sciurus carolinensis]
MDAEQRPGTAPRFFQGHSWSLIRVLGGLTPAGQGLSGACLSPGKRCSEQPGSRSWMRPSTAPCPPVTFPRSFPGGASREGRAVTSSVSPGGPAGSLARAASRGWGGDSRRWCERTEGPRRREAAPLPDPCREGVGPPGPPLPGGAAVGAAGGGGVCARRAGSVRSGALAPARAASASAAVCPLGCLPSCCQPCARARPLLSSGAQRGDEERGGAGAHRTGRAGRTAGRARRGAGP